MEKTEFQSTLQVVIAHEKYLFLVIHGIERNVQQQFDWLQMHAGINPDNLKINSSTFLYNQMKKISHDTQLWYFFLANCNRDPFASTIKKIIERNEVVKINRSIAVHPQSIQQIFKNEKQKFQIILTPMLQAWITEQAKSEPAFLKGLIVSHDNKHIKNMVL